MRAKEAVKGVEPIPPPRSERETTAEQTGAAYQIQQTVSPVSLQGTNPFSLEVEDKFLILALLVAIVALLLQKRRLNAQTIHLEQIETYLTEVRIDIKKVLEMQQGQQVSSLSPSLGV